MKRDFYGRLVAGRKGALLVATAFAGFSGQAYAQQDPGAPVAPGVSASAAANAGDNGEIVVTALKRDTRLQDTPISISAVSSQTIANSGVQSMADLGASVPSLNFVDGGPSSRRVVIRGIQASGEPTVGVYYDETPVTGSIGASNDAGGSTPELRLFDVERVEVLRGPQGTLYGSGSMGGTLRIIYKKPSFEDEGAADVTLSGTEGGGFNYEANGVINAPIVQDKIAVRAVGFYRKRDGYIDNTALGIKNINDDKSYGGRVMLRLKPTETLTLDAAAYFNRTRTDTPNWTLEDGKYNSDNYTRLPIRDDLDLYSLTANWDLGGVTATGVVSYMKRDLSSQSDVSRFIRNNRTPARCSTLVAGGAACSTDQLSDFYGLVDSQSTSVLFPQQKMDVWTAELRLSSSGSGPLNWTAGGFFSSRKTDVANPQVNADPTTGEVIYPLQTATIRFIDDKLKQVAGFGEVSWDITSRFNLTAGGRYFKYTKDIYGETTVPSILVGARVTPLTHVESDEDGWVFKFNGSYKITDNVMFYAEAAQGFRPGGANQVLGLDAAFTPYGSDRLWNYEAGLKTTSFDRRLFLNVDVFQINWSDMQVTARTPNGAFSYITNAGKARIRGVEAEGTLRPMDGVNIQANASYIDAKLTEDQPNAGTVNPAAGFKGDRIPYVPKFTAGVGAEYDWAINDLVGGMARLDANHVGSSWSEFRPTYVYARKIDSYQLVNVRAGIEGPDKQWGAYLFVTNLLNDTAITRATSSAIAAGRTLVTSAAPRTYGVNFRTSF